MSGAGRSTAANVPGGPGLVRRRQPAAGPAADHGRARRSGAGRRRPGWPPSSTCAAGPSSPTCTAALASSSPTASTRASSSWRPVDDALVRRFESVRRPHPLQGDGRLVDGIARERELLRDLRGDADLVLDTTDLNVHELRAKVLAGVRRRGRSRRCTRRCISFGFKYGLPVDADLVVDCRFLPNPHWVPELRPLTGPDAAGARLRARRSRARRSSSTATSELLDHHRAPATCARASATPRSRSAAPAASTAGRHDRGARRAGWPTRHRRRRRPPRPGSRVSVPGPGSGDVPAVVALGGGHGLAASLSALRRVTDRLTAVVTVADDGGSSGRLRASWACCRRATCGWRWRRCAATTSGAAPGADVVQHRFRSEGDLHDHAVGNLLIVALWELLGDSVERARLGGPAARRPGPGAADVASCRWTSRPRCVDRAPTGVPTRRGPRPGRGGDDRRPGRGVRARARRTRRPARRPCEAVLAADWVVLGPGSWFTSVLPHLLVPELAAALRTTSARRLVALNLAPQPGETDGFSPETTSRCSPRTHRTCELDVVLADAGGGRRPAALGRSRRRPRRRARAGRLAVDDGTPTARPGPSGGRSASPTSRPARHPSDRI